MARERELIEEIRQPEAPRYELTQSTHSDVLVDTLVEFLRECFQNHPEYPYVPRQDSYGPDFEKTQIVIVDKYTEDALFLPTITIAIDSVATQWIQFTQNPFKTVLKYQMNDDGSIKRYEDGSPVPSHWEYVGAYDSSVTFLLSANDTIEREELMNLLHVIFAESGRDTLYMRGIFIKNVSVGGQTEEEFRNDYIFQQSVTLDVYSEWKRKIPVGDTLRSVGYKMNVTDLDEGEQEPSQIKELKTVPVYNLENTPYIVDDASGEPVLVCFELDAQDFRAPKALTFNPSSMKWQVSAFWKKVLEETLIPWQNFALDINKADPTQEYLKHAGAAILQAQAARAMATSAGRTLFDGTKVIGDTFIFEDGKVELKNFKEDEPLIHSTIVEADDTVIFRLTEKNEDQSILVAKNVTLDSDGNVIGGLLYKRTDVGDSLLTTPPGRELDKEPPNAADAYGNLEGYGILEVDGLITDPLLDGSDIDSMSPVDLFMIYQFADQPYRYTISQVTQEIDRVLADLGDPMQAISYKTAKMNDLINIKQQLIERSERFLLSRPVGF